jgi:hypothetical protein
MDSNSKTLGFVFFLMSCEKMVGCTVRTVPVEVGNLIGRKNLLTPVVSLKVGT